MDAQKFGAFIAQCRKEKSMTQSELAAKIMVTDKAVSRWERGKGFPDINLLLPLAEALEVSVLELMHSERQKDKVQLFQDDTIIVHLMENAVEMNKQNKQQDRIIACISCITMFFVTFFIKFYGYGSIGGGIVAGAFIAFIPIGFYLLISNRKDITGRKIYTIFTVLGICLTLALLTFLHVNSLILIWGTFFLLFLIIIVLIA
ncbi:TPA: multiprotein-bridging factor 1 family protein [Enterococcus faecium]